MKVDLIIGAGSLLLAHNTLHYPSYLPGRGGPVVVAPVDMACTIC